jgi:hypothetical protein
MHVRAFSHPEDYELQRQEAIGPKSNWPAPRVDRIRTLHAMILFAAVIPNGSEPSCNPETGDFNMFIKLLAELIGTFWLVLGGCGSAVLAAKFPEVGIGLLGVSLAFGLTVLTAAYALGPISGGHFNPAVTVGLWAGGRFPPGQIVSNVLIQIAGAIVAAVLPTDDLHQCRIKKRREEWSKESTKE